MKRWFLQRSARERLLLLVFAFAAALVWLLSAAGRVRQAWTDHRGVATDVVAQKLWLERKDEIEARARRAAASLAPERTLDATHLVGEVSAMAQRAGLAPAMESPRTQRNDPFAYHTVQVSFRRADLAALVRFYRELSERAPYLALEECTLAASRSNPAELDAQFTIFSVQVAK